MGSPGETHTPELWYEILDTVDDLVDRETETRFFTSVGRLGIHEGLTERVIIDHALVIPTEGSGEGEGVWLTDSAMYFSEHHSRYPEVVTHLRLSAQQPRQPIPGVITDPHETLWRIELDPRLPLQWLQKASRLLTGTIPWDEVKCLFPSYMERAAYLPAGLREQSGKKHGGNLGRPITDTLGI
jgi:hypothetical protein